MFRVLKIVVAVLFALSLFVLSSTPAFVGYDYHTVVRVSDQPLFAADGSVNEDVLDSLMEILSDPVLDPLLRNPKHDWPTGMRFEYELRYTATTARDFSYFVTGEPDNMSHSGAVVIRLFETIPNSLGVEHGYLTQFTSQWWQLVYRSTAQGEDVLTLWMVQPYRLTHFSGNRYGRITGRENERYFDRTQSPGRWGQMSLNYINTIPSDDCIVAQDSPAERFFFEANYSQSIARANLQRDLNYLLAHFGVEEYLVAPRDIPGQWQSSRYQTGSNFNRRFYAPGQFYRASSSGRADDLGFPQPEDGPGAAGLIWGRHQHFSLVNGKDGLSLGPIPTIQFPNTSIVSTYDDLLWLPSDFEIRSMGHNKDPATFQTFIATPRNAASGLRWNYNTSAEQDSRVDLTGGRSGLWELNGYDRGFNYAVLGQPFGWEPMLSWLRSADSLAFGSANTVCHAGNRYSNGVTQRAGMRPGVHLSLTRLSS